MGTSIEPGSHNLAAAGRSGCRVARRWSRRRAAAAAAAGDWNGSLAHGQVRGSAGTGSHGLAHGGGVALVDAQPVGRPVDPDCCRAGSAMTFG